MTTFRMDKRKLKDAIWNFREATARFRRLGKQAVRGTVSPVYTEKRISQLSDRLHASVGTTEATLRIGKASFNQGFQRAVRRKARAGSGEAS